VSLADDEVQRDGDEHVHRHAIQATRAESPPFNRAHCCQIETLRVPRLEDADVAWRPVALNNHFEELKRSTSTTSTVRHHGLDAFLKK
jgi:hypothetical protein